MIESGVLVRLVWAEALEATGDHAAACQAIAEARTALFAFADRITDAELRRGALITVPEHARTLALAREWIGDP
jgi:eukaryotic-like serine/threonine-protein kinase